VEIARGDIVVVAAKGPYTGKPRPAVVVQSDLFTPTHSSVTICPITSDCVDAPLFRLPLPPGDRTGLEVVSQIMADKPISVPAGAIVTKVGHCNDDEMAVLSDALRLWLSL